jgi:CBS domain-containing protein
MATLKAKDIMSKELIVFKKDTSVKEAARILTEKGIGGAPVVNEEGKLVGIVTEADLIMQDIKLHFPTYLHLLDGYVYLPGSLHRFEEELRKAIGADVGDVMTKEVITVSPEVEIEDIATLMVKKDVGRVPVIDGEKLVGIITKGDIVKSLAR